MRVLFGRSKRMLRLPWKRKVLLRSIWTWSSLGRRTAQASGLGTGRGSRQSGMGCQEAILLSLFYNSTRNSTFSTYSSPSFLLSPVLQDTSAEPSSDSESNGGYKTVSKSPSGSQLALRETQFGFFREFLWKTSYQIILRAEETERFPFGRLQADFHLAHSRSYRRPVPWEVFVSDGKLSNLLLPVLIPIRENLQLTQLIKITGRRWSWWCMAVLDRILIYNPFLDTIDWTPIPENNILL